MNQKGIAPLVIVAIIIVVAAVAVGGIYVATRGGEGNGDGGGNGGGNGGGVGTATSLQFTVDSTVGEVSSTMTYKVKDIGSDDMKIRVDGTTAGQDFVLIVNGAQQRVWMYIAGQWTDYSDEFLSYWGAWSESFEGYQTELSGWTGGTWTSPDGTVTIRDVILNPSLSDSLFEH